MATSLAAMVVDGTGLRDRARIHFTITPYFVHNVLSPAENFPATVLSRDCSCKNHSDEEMAASASSWDWFRLRQNWSDGRNPEVIHLDKEWGVRTLPVGYGSRRSPFPVSFF
jgi:hypothetical protein